MVRALRLSAVVMLALTLGATPSRADDLEQAQAQIHAAWQKHRSLTATMKVTSAVGPSGQVASQGQGRFELMRKADQVLIRMELEMTAAGAPGTAASQPVGKLTAVIDGQHAYMLQEAMGQRMAFRTDIDPRMTGDPVLMLTELIRSFDLKLLPEEKVNEQPAYVVEATPKTAGGAVPTKTVFYFSRQDGVILRMVQHNAARETVETTTFSDHQFDVDIDPEHFKFKLPDGVQLIDRATAPASQPAAP